METAPLKAFATSARTELIREVTARITAVLSQGSPERVESPTVVAGLEKAVAAGGGGEKGKAHVADKVAYTWFNRIIALRFMDANGYTGIGVVSPATDQVGQPEVLAVAKRGQIDKEVVSNDRIMATIAGLLNGTRQPRQGVDAQAEAYSLLLAAYCQFWYKAMPFMFERQGDFTELLIPANLLAGDSVLNRSVEVLSEDACKDVEVIGWLYQFYISERHDEVLAGFKKNKKAGADEIPAATQLFTPHWIVRYLVENSVGRLWMLNRPGSSLVRQMDYYIAPVDEEADFLKIARPEELKVIDPACGSGHMLTYAFDLLYEIYEEEGYAPSEIPSLILANNLYGTEVDPRAGALTAFALTMKAAAKRTLFLKNPVEPNVRVIEPISFGDDELDFLGTKRLDQDAETYFWNQFACADTVGSLIQPDPTLTGILSRHVEMLDDADIFKSNAIMRAKRVVEQAEYLAQKYPVVLTNPPYMGSRNMSSVLSAWIREAYPDEKQDLYACFIVRCDELAVSRGYIAMVTGDTWMTISSFEKLRRRLLSDHAIPSFIHMRDMSYHADIFGANTAFVIDKDGRPDTTGSYIYLDASGTETKAQHLRDAVQGSGGDRMFLVQSEQFEEVPGAPLVFRLSEAVRNAFTDGVPLRDLAEPRQGLLTGDSESFVRQWWEVSGNRTALACESRESARASRARWFPYNKGGEFRKWYGNHEHLVNWEDDGRVIRAFGSENGGRIRSRPQNADYYFKSSVSWSNVSSGAPAFRAYPAGFIAAGSTGDGAYPESEELSVNLLGILNSSVTHELLAAIAPTLTFNVGTIANLPIIAQAADSEFEDTVRELIDISRDDWNQSEMSWGFESSPLMAQGLSSVEAAVQVHHEASDDIAARAHRLESLNNESVAKLYRLAGEVDTGVELSRVSLGCNSRFRFGAGLSNSDYRRRFTTSAVQDLLSYAVGCMLGRYSLDQPGLILADQGSMLRDYLTKVSTPTFTPDDDNVIPIVDGDWFEDDIVGRLRQFLRVAFGEKYFEENLRFVTESLAVKNLREYFITKAGKSRFYDDHVQRYKKRPIYWMFSSPKGSFNALIYLHRYTPSTASTALTYLREYVTKLESSLQQAERAGNAKEADRLRKILVELSEYEHDTLYPKASENVVIDLDDGVKVNYPKLGGALRKIAGLESSGD